MVDPRLVPRVREYCRDVHGIIMLSWPDAPRFADFKAIGVPTLVLRGGDKHNLAVDAGANLAAKLPHARVVTIPGAGHDPWLDQPAAFFEAVLAFLRELAPPARAAP
jgi:pimeloyl-ACP methyl ester carboxylesterase